MTFVAQYGGKENKSYISKVRVLQKRIAKLVLNISMRSPTAGLFKQLHWLSFTDRCKYHSAVLVYKTINHMAPQYMCEVLTFSQNEKYNLRSTTHNDLTLQSRPHSKYFKDSFGYYSMNIWNSIPSHIRNATSIISFKCKFKHHLIDNS